MADVREFWLTNAKGVKYSLHSTTQAFLNEPSGLGFGVDASIVKLGNSSFILSEDYDLGSAQGELIFFGTRQEVYNQYFKFTQFLYAKPIQMHYRTPDRTESYYCQVRVVSLEKTEVGQDGLLRCPISMLRQSMWYNDTKNIVEARNTASDGKKYPLYRPYHYGTVSTSNIEIYNAGIADAPMLVEVDGRVTDPAWSLYDDDNNLYGSAKILGTYDYVSVDSDDLSESISLTRDGSVIANAVNYQDLTVGDPRQVYVTFLKLRPGTSRMTFTFGTGEFGGVIRVTWRNAYVTV